MALPARSGRSKSRPSGDARYVRYIRAAALEYKEAAEGNQLAVHHVSRRKLPQIEPLGGPHAVSAEGQYANAVASSNQPGEPGNFMPDSSQLPFQAQLRTSPQAAPPSRCRLGIEPMSTSRLAEGSISVS